MLSEDYRISQFFLGIFALFGGCLISQPDWLFSRDEDEPISTSISDFPNRGPAMVSMFISALCIALSNLTVRKIGAGVNSLLVSNYYGIIG